LRSKNAAAQGEETMAMKKWILAACFLTVAAGSALAADVRLDSYRHPENQKMREFYLLYLDGVKGGLMAYNSRLMTHGGQPAFYTPGDLALTTEQTEEIMLRSADKRSAKGNMLVAILLLSGLADTYPCEKSKR
jgi:hypothetical protein